MIYKRDIPTKRVAALLAAAMLIPTTACAAGGESGSADYASSATEPAAAYDESYGGAENTAEYAPTAVPGAPVNVQTKQALVITATVEMHADDVTAAATAVIDLVSSRDGVVESRNIVNDNAEERFRGSANLTVRVPPEKAETFIEELGDIAPVDSVAQDATDVSDQLTDLDLRIQNAEASLERIRDLMDKATKIEDLASLENELSIRQLNLEQLQAQKANLGADVAMATITIGIRSTADLDTGVSAPSDVSIVGAAKTGWRGFVEVAYSILLVVVTLWPVVLLVVLGLVAFRWRRRRRKAAKNDPDATPPSDQSPTQQSEFPSPQMS